MLDDKLLNISSGDQLYRLFAGVIIASSLVICVISLISAVRWINKPFAGFLFYNNLVITDITPYKNGDPSLNRASDRIVEVNGEKVNSGREVYEIVDNVPLGTIINYTIAGSGELSELSIPTARFTLVDFLFLFGVIYFVGLVFLIVGTVVCYLKSHLYAGRFFFLFCFSVGLWFVTSFHSQSTYLFDLFDKLPFLGFTYCPAFYIPLALVFPSDSFLTRKTLHTYTIFLILFLLSSVLYIAHLTYFDSYEVWKNVQVLSWLYVGLGSLALPVSAAAAYFKGASALERQRAYAVLWGSFAGLLLPSLAAVSIVISEANIPFNLLALPVVIFPVGIAYAIVKHKLFDIDEIVRKALTYTALTAVLSVAVILMTVTLDAALASFGGWRNPLFSITLAVILVVALNPLKNWIQSFIDLTFFRAKYDIIGQTISAMTSLLNLNEIASRITHTVEQTMFPHSASVILFDWDVGDYVVYAASRNPQGAARVVIKKDSELVQLLDRYKKEIFKEDLAADERYAPYKDRLTEVFDSFNAALFIPLLFKEQLVGILCLGEKRGGLSYTSEDVELLRTLADQSAIATQNASAYKLIEDYARKLEEANRELRETQAQLIQAEKMSAVGQLAAGIVHEIRNPLTIIESSRHFLSQTIDKADFEASKKYLDYIKQQVERMSRLIDSLLKFSRSEPQNLELVNVNQALENILILMKKQFSDNNVRIITNFNYQIPSIMGNPSQLWQVFVNIIINAVQAMPGGGEIQISTGYRGEAQISVGFTDTGVGISKKDVSRVFNPFFTTKDSGAGLGLSISYGIIEKHGGRITVNSEKGKGSTFVVELPVRYVDTTVSPVD